MLTETPFYPYIENADALLREIALAGIEERYEVEMKDRAITRLEEELEYVKTQNSAGGFLGLVDVLRTLEATPEEFCVAGTLASTLLAYVLGLGEIDPLNCTPKLYPEFFFGPHGEKFPDFSVWMTPNLCERLLEYFTRFHGWKEVTVKYYDNGQVRGVTFADPVYSEANSENPSIEFYISFIIIDNTDDNVKELVEEGPAFEKIKPQTFEEYVRCYGLSRGTDTWEGNGEELLSSGKATFPELIAFREDVYEYLLDHGMEQSKAWEITNLVRKGGLRRKERCSDVLKDMKAAGIPDWFLWSCQQISYLFPRAHAMVLMKHYWEKIKKLS